jgi:tau tubulin kinase
MFNAWIIGVTYQAEDTQTQRMVAIKFETVRAKKHTLKVEVMILKKLLEHSHDTHLPSFACKFYGCGKVALDKCICPMPQIKGKLTTQDKCDCSKEYNFLAMQQLGSNLADLRKKQSSGSFSLSTTSLLLCQMLTAIHRLHDIGYIHRDIKPSNFAISLVRNNTKLRKDDFYKGRAKVYMLDYGLCRRYVSSDGTRIREARDKAGFRGTARYASINAHDNKELGRRDDLWSLYYVMVEFLQGKLPWRGERDRNVVGVMKRKQHSEQFVAHLPPSCSKLFKYLNSLTYQEAPDYNYIHDLFQELFTLSKDPEDVPYDWDKPACSSSSVDSVSILTSLPAEANRDLLETQNLIISEDASKPSSVEDLVGSLAEVNLKSKDDTLVSAKPIPHPPPRPSSSNPFLSIRNR